jgi:hypothetical protein
MFKGMSPMKSLLVLVPACSLLVAPAALAGSGSSGAMGGGAPLAGQHAPLNLGYQSPYAGVLEPAANYYGLPHKVRALLQLRREGLKLRDEDGGTLTPEHHAYLQAKLDAIQAGQQ